MKQTLLSAAVLGLCVASSTPQADTPLWQQPSYVTAILKARAGDTAMALDMLEQQRGRGQLQGSLLDDYLTVLCWSGRGADALQQLPDNLQVLRTDSLELLARTARDQRQYPQAILLYQSLLQRESRAGWTAGLAMAQAEAGQAAAGLATLDKAPVTAMAADARELVRARAYVLTLSGQLTEALAYIQQQLVRDPQDTVLQNQLVDVQLRLGIPQMALQSAQAQARPDAVLLRQAEFDHAAMLSRWGRIQEGLDSGLARHAQTDAALRLNQQLSASLRPDESRFALLALDDRLQMLDQRGLFAETVQLYQANPAARISPYAQAAVADAYLSLRQPEAAVERYRAALAERPHVDEAMDWHVGLVYALLESNRFDEANAEMAILRQQTPRQRLNASGQRGFNPDYQRIMLLDAMLRAYQDDTRGGWQALDGLLRDAPFNADLRQSQGGLALLRGWPRRAADIYRRLKVDEPASLEASAGLANAAMDTWEYQQVPPYLDWLQQQKPDWKELETLQRRYSWTQRPELTVEVGRDLSGGQGSGEQNAWDTLSRLYSAPWQHWRLFAQHELQRASFVDEPNPARYETAGLGAQYRSVQGQGEFGLLAGLDGQHQAGAFAGYSWTPDDQWSFGARYEQNSADTPLKARLSQTRGNKVELQTGYRVDDYREFSLQLSQLSLSDGNLRQSLAGGWTERWHSGPTYKLDTTLSLATSRNRDTPQALYFNPLSDVEADLTITQDWRLWSRYDNSLHQRLGLTLGRYQQQNYGTGSVWGVMLEQEWRWSERASLRYGYTRVRHPYDGQADFGSKVYMNLDWRF
ncbi:MAG: poly-beta-1,6 N-acetyl-D-glucosamine export porin PgaA [Aquitalea sp.]|nr:poly-beta-1,6 N-acetyl-D-glucosamine export porin PgaA [Aquitalea sp.]